MYSPVTLFCKNTSPKRLICLLSVTGGATGSIIAMLQPTLSSSTAHKHVSYNERALLQLRCFWTQLLRHKFHIAHIFCLLIGKSCMWHDEYMLNCCNPCAFQLLAQECAIAAALALLLHTLNTMLTTFNTTYDTSATYKLHDKCTLLHDIKNVFKA
jgi:hypothetical protein